MLVLIITQRSYRNTINSLLDLNEIAMVIHTDVETLLIVCRNTSA